MKAARALAILLSLLALGTGTVEAQLRPSERAEPPGRSIEPGVRVGLDYQNDAPILGGQVRLSIDPWLRLDLIPSVEFTFQEGLTERQINLDAAFFLDPGRTVFVGGGAAYRNTIYLDDQEDPLPNRETRTGFNVLAGLHLAFTTVPVAMTVEARWSFVDNFEPQTLVVGVGYPLSLGF